MIKKKLSCHFSYIVHITILALSYVFWAQATSLPFRAVCQKKTNSNLFPAAASNISAATYFKSVIEFTEIILYHDMSLMGYEMTHIVIEDFAYIAQP